MKQKFGVAIACRICFCAMFLGNMFPIIDQVFCLNFRIALNEFFDLPENSRPG